MPATKGKAAAKKPPSKRKRVDDDDDDDDATSAKRTRKRAPASRGKAKMIADDDEEEEEQDTRTKKVPELLLANKWDLEKGIDPTGWWISEKLDGVRYVGFHSSLLNKCLTSCVRAYFDGKSMISRLGNPFTPPQWFLDST